MNFRQISGRIFHKNIVQQYFHKSTFASSYLTYGEFTITFKISNFHNSKQKKNILGKDPAPLFFSPDIQNILFSITRIELEKVFRRRTVADNQASYK